MIKRGVVCLLVFAFQSSLMAAEEVKDITDCHLAGPQSPRDIDGLVGTNSSIFSFAPDYQQMNLCNIHFHDQAEHKAKDFAVFAGDESLGGGYQCGISQTLSSNELKPVSGPVCKGLKPGDTVEVHWVHSSCNVKPGPGLGSCTSNACANPNLRVEAQVFTLVNDSSALQFEEFIYDDNVVDGYHQALALPTNSGRDRKSVV